MKSILVPTDFSDTANNALHYASALAKDYGLELHILHAIHVPVIDPNGPISVADAMMESAKKRNNDKLDAIAEEIHEQYGITPGLHADFGLGSDLVVNTAKDLEVDLIVMGTSGESGFMRRLLGSVTAAVIEKTSLPILAIPKDAKYQGFKVAVFGKDYKESVRDELEETYNFIRKNDARLDIISVESGKNAYSKEIIYEEGGIREVSVFAGNAKDGLLTYMENENADLLVLKHHQRSFFQDLLQKSTTKELLKECTIPLYVFS